MKLIVPLAALVALSLLLDSTPFVPEHAAVPLVARADVPAMSRAMSDRDAVERAVGHYMNGWLNGDVESLKKAFHPDAKLFSVRNDSLRQLTQTEWYAFMSAAPRAPSDGRRIRIVSTEVAGTVAQVKVESSIPRGSYTDYLSLARFDGQWMIVNKTFHFEPASARSSR